MRTWSELDEDSRAEWEYLLAENIGKHLSDGKTLEEAERLGRAATRLLWEREARDEPARTAGGAAGDPGGCAG